MCVSKRLGEPPGTLPLCIDGPVPDAFLGVSEREPLFDRVAVAEVFGDASAREPGMLVLFRTGSAVADFLPVSGWPADKGDDFIGGRAS